MAGSDSPHLPGDTHVSELDQALLAQDAEALVGRAGLQEELRQAHGLAPEQGPHGGPARAPPAGPDGSRRLWAARAHTVSRGDPGIELLLRPGRGSEPWSSGLYQLSPVQPPRPPLRPPPTPPSRPRPLGYSRFRFRPHTRARARPPPADQWRQELRPMAAAGPTGANPASMRGIQELSPNLTKSCPFLWCSQLYRRSFVDFTCQKVHPTRVVQFCDF